MIRLLELPILIEISGNYWKNHNQKKHLKMVCKSCQISTSIKHG